MKNDKLLKKIDLPAAKKDKKDKISIKELKPFVKLYKPYAGSMFWCVLLIIVGAVISVFMPIYAGKMLASFAENFNAMVSLKYAIIAVGLEIAYRIGDAISGYGWDKITNNVGLDLKRQVVERLNLLQHKCFETTGTATFSARLGDANSLVSLPLDVIFYVTRMLSKVGFLAYIFTLNIWVALFMLGYVVLLIVLKWAYLDMRQRHNKITKEVNETLGNIQYENIRGMKDIRSLNTTTAVETEIDKNNTYRYTLMHKFYTRRSVASTCLDIFKNLMVLAFIGLCIYLIVDGQLLLAGFMIVYNFRGNVLSFADSFLSFKRYLDDATLSAHRVNELFDEQKYPTEKFGDTVLKNVKGEIEFKNVNFEYVQNMPVLSDVSFKIEPKTVVSFVGESGTGKSTIVSLLNKLYTLQEGCGQITLDGIDINTLTRDCLRNNICVVSQNPYVFDMTIAENLRLASPNATDDELNKALKKAELYNFVQAQKDKLETKLGENGIKLSGGQKQRLAIARALLKNAKVIVFDEATSSLDNNNQEKIKNVMRGLSREHTIIMIAHRLSTVVDSDNIIFIKDGKVHRQGTHQQLMETCPEYNELYKVEE